MKKMKKGISITVIILLIAVVAVLATTLVLVLNRDKNEPIAGNDETIIENEQNEEQNDENSQEEVGPKTWIQTVKFPETTNPVEFNLIKGIDSKPPIKLEQFDNGKYIFEYINGGSQRVKKLSELPHEYIYGLSNTLYVEDLEGNAVITAKLYDGEENLSFYDMAKSGELGFGISQYFLIQSLEVEKEAGDQTDRNLLQKIVDLLGCPTHIYPFGEGNVSLNLSYITYHMIYEYDEYVIHIQVQEMGPYEMTKIGHINYETKKVYEDWIDSSNEYHNSSHNTDIVDILPLLKQKQQ